MAKLKNYFQDKYRDENTKEYAMLVASARSSLSELSKTFEDWSKACVMYKETLEDLEELADRSAGLFESYRNYLTMQEEPQE